MQDMNVSICPVAHVARQLSPAIAAYRQLDEAIARSRGARRSELEHQFTAVEDRLYAFEAAATLDRTRSAMGAVLQLTLASNEIERLVSLTEPDELRAARECQRKIDRVLYSVLTFLEESYGIRREDIGADFYARRDMDPHEAVEQALAA